MAEFVEIPQANENHDNYPCWIHTTTTDGVNIKPTIRCKCGVYCGIGLHHVHADGRITASFYHQYKEDQPERHKGCGWHVYLKMLNYNLGEFVPEK